MKRPRLIVGIVVSGLLLAACSGGPSAVKGNLDFTLPEATTEAVTASSGPDLDAATLEKLGSAEQVYHTFSNGYRVAFRVLDGFVVTSGDIIVGEAGELAALISRYESLVASGDSMMVAAQGVGLVPGSASLWGSKRIPYVIDSTFTASERSSMQQFVDRWNAKAVSVKFVAAVVTRKGKSYTSAASFAYFTKSSSGCGSSYVGNINRRSGASYTGQPITIGQTCVREDVAHHEMGHAAGLWHEQQRCDRDLFVIVTSSDTTNYGKRCGGGVTDYGFYDYTSVMHYSPNSVLQVRNPPLSGNYIGNPAQAGAASTLGASDIISINNMYGN